MGEGPAHYFSDTPDGGLRPGPARDGRVFVLYGSRPDLVGWAATVAGHPGSELLPQVSHF